MGQVSGTPTERLCATLDERGVPHSAGSSAVTYWQGPGGFKSLAYDAPRSAGAGMLVVTHVATVEEAALIASGRYAVVEAGA